MKTLRTIFLILVTAVFAMCALSSCDLSGLGGDDCTHTGGTATCTAKAVCSDCGESYGELADHTYNETDQCTICNHVNPAEDSLTPDKDDAKNFTALLPIIVVGCVVIVASVVVGIILIKKKINNQ